MFQTTCEGIPLLCVILDRVICCLKSSNVTGVFAAGAHSDQAVEREVDLDDVQENKPGTGRRTRRRA